MSFENRPKAPATQKERNAMAIRLIEHSAYIDYELGQELVKLVRKGLVYFYPNGNIEITKEGERVVDENHNA